MIERSSVRVPDGAAGYIFSPGPASCADSFRYPFHPRVTAVARKRSRLVNMVLNVHRNRTAY